MRSAEVGLEGTVSAPKSSLKTNYLIYEALPYQNKCFLICLIGGGGGVGGCLKELQKFISFGRARFLGGYQ